MSAMLLFYNNHADAGNVAFSGGSWALPLSNLQDPRPSKKARASSASADDTKLRVDLGIALPFRGLALTHTNLTAAARYRITWYADAFTTAIDDTGWLEIAGYPVDDPDGIGASIFHIFAAAATARYWQFELDDGGNGDGYIEIGRLCMMDCWAPPYNFDAGNNLDGADANTPRQNALGGAGYFNPRQPARLFNFAFNLLPGSEQAVVRRIRKICNLDRQVVVVPDPGDTANLNDTCFLATLRQMPALTLLQVGNCSTGFEATEVVG